MSRILIVEDEQPIATMLSEFLSEAGYETEIARDGAEALDRIDDAQPNLIIMDLMMPRLTGGEAARILRREPSTAGIPILAISAIGDAETMIDLLAVDAVLAKPFDLEDLRQHVDAMLDPMGVGAPANI
jgi:DNA-binding response OmpR family regulator